MTTVCVRCGTPHRDGAKFCATCGAPSRAHARAQRDGRKSAKRAQQRTVAAIAAIVVIPLVGAVAVFRLFEPEAGVATSLLFDAIFVAAGIVAAWLLGERSALEGGRASALRWYLLAPVLAMLTYAAAVLYVSWIDVGIEDPDVVTREVPFAFEILSVVVLAPLLEEWVCRGVLWSAFRRIANPVTTLLSTAVIFAFLHGLGGGFVFELPHRFVAGLAFGYLRLRSGSLWPAVLAHAVHNSYATFL